MTQTVTKVCDCMEELGKRLKCFRTSESSVEIDKNVLVYIYLKQVLLANRHCIFVHKMTYAPVNESQITCARS